MNRLLLTCRWLLALACAAWILSGPLRAVEALFGGRLGEAPAAYLTLGADARPTAASQDRPRSPLLTRDGGPSSGAQAGGRNEEGPAHASAGRAFVGGRSRFRSR